MEDFHFLSFLQFGWGTPISTTSSRQRMLNSRRHKEQLIATATGRRCFKAHVSGEGLPNSVDKLVPSSGTSHRNSALFGWAFVSCFAESWFPNLRTQTPADEHGEPKVLCLVNFVHKAWLQTQQFPIFAVEPPELWVGVWCPCQYTRSIPLALPVLLEGFSCSSWCQVRHLFHSLAMQRIGGCRGQP